MNLTGGLLRYLQGGSFCVPTQKPTGKGCGRDRLLSVCSNFGERVENNGLVRSGFWSSKRLVWLPSLPGLWHLICQEIERKSVCVI